MKSDPISNIPRKTERRTFRQKARRIFSGRNLKIAAAVIVFVFAIGFPIYQYNKFVTLEQEVGSAMGQVESSLQMRENLYPILIRKAEEFFKHEDKIFLTAVDARAKSLEGRTEKVDPDKSKPDSPWEALVSRLFAIAERYPELKSQEPFQLMMSRIGDVEMEIFRMRVQYNEVASRYNARISSFPPCLFAPVFGFTQEPFFKCGKTSEWMIDRRIVKTGKK